MVPRQEAFSVNNVLTSFRFLPLRGVDSSHIRTYPSKDVVLTMNKSELLVEQYNKDHGNKKMHKDVLFFGRFDSARFVKAVLDNVLPK